nr:MAG TPA: hypothetical protein [Caudoviricetes sp.]
MKFSLSYRESGREAIGASEIVKCITPYKQGQLKDCFVLLCVVP